MIDVHAIEATIAPLKIDDATALAEALTKPPRPAIRLRPGVPVESLPFETESVDWHPRGYFLPPAARPGAYLSYAAGDYYIQDAASLLALTLLDPRPGEFLCDLCASPGGKSTAILESIGDAGWLLSNEAVDSRLPMLQFNLARHGATNYLISRADPADLASHLAGMFDAVLVDAPCTGQSLVARGKQSAAAFHPRTVEHCASRQTRILAAAAHLVRPGGRLVYSTCTFAFAENEGQTENFISRHSNWFLEPLRNRDAWQSEFGAGHYRLWPQRHQCGGAYAARLVRKIDPLHPSLDSVHHRTPVLRPAPLPEPISEWGELHATLYRRDEQFFGWPREPAEQLLRVGISGPEICFRKGSTWFPSYALAMRRDEKWVPRAGIELNDHQAAQYMEGNALPGEHRGWLVAKWRGRSLGWLKGDGSRLKNHLPKPGRMNAVRG